MAEAPKKTKHSKLDAVPINLGLEQLYPPDEPMKPSTKFAFEIIAIPGLGANPEWTWKKDKVHWLKDGNMLARKVPNARISVFQYQSQWFGRGAVDQKLDNVANQLLYALERSRGSESKVPIIFVAHCLGGIILEKAILTARLRQNDFPSVFPWIAGCVFLGTPFRGTETQAKAEILAKFAETINLGASSSLLKLLEKDSDTLRRLRNDFVKLSAEAHIRLFCFFESQKSNLASQLPLMKGTSFQKMELIVDEESATFDGSENLSLVSDHFQLNKYTGPKDGNFVAVSDEIKVTAQKAPGILKSRQNALRQMLVDDKTYHALVAALGKGFSDLDATMCGSYRGPKAAQPSWVLDVENYKTWKDNPDNPLLWTHGKAGTGQASIASSIIEDLNKTRQQGTIVTSFFCDQGDENRRSLRGLLKIIIRQVIDVSQDMASHLLTDSKKGKKTGTQDLDLDSLSKVSTLWDALHSMARDLPAGFLYVVVFGIEQLSKESLSEWLELIRSIPTGDDRSEEAPVKILLLSRSGRPDIEKALKPRFLQINLDDSENAERVSDALRADISARVNELALPAPLAYFVKRHIHSRAEDNSIYVSLVIQELKNVQGTNMTAAEIRALLESFPYGLTEMFEHIRKRVLQPTTTGIGYTKEILRCLILAHRAPTMREIAIMADLPLEDRDDLEMLKAYIRRCGAFVTLVGSELDEDNNTVEWVDLSAKEHLEKFAKDELSLELADMQHGIIGLRCLQYVYSVTEQYEAHKAAKATGEEEKERRTEANKEAHDPDDGDAEPREDPSSPLPPTNDIPPSEADQHSDHGEHEDCDDSRAPSIAGADDEERIPTLDDALQYPVQYWIEHAKLAPEDVIEEFDLSHDFWQHDSQLREDWWAANSAIHPFPDQANVSPLHIATITGYSAFVDHLLQNGREDDVSHTDSVGFQPLFYACYNCEYEIMQALLGTSSDVNFVSDEGKMSALYGAAWQGNDDIVTALIERDAEVNFEQDEKGTPLYAATTADFIETMKILLEQKADPNITGGWHRLPMNAAAFNGSVEAVQLLLDHGASVDPEEDYIYGSALGAAARRGHDGVAKLLITKGWNVQKPMNTYKSFLTAAATYGHLEVVEALLEKETRITVMQEALQAAAQNGKDPVVKAILDRNPTLKHHKAFMTAASYGRDEVLTLLIKRGIPQDLLDTALYDAADHEHEETVKVLLEFGASPNAEGEEYGTALTASAFDGTTGIMQALLEKGADVNKQGGTYGTALQAAAFFGDADNVKMLIEHGALVNTESIGLYGNPLQAACQTGDEDTVKMLLDNKADVNAHGGEHGFAIIAAVEEGDDATVKILLEHNPDVHVRGGEDNAPLIVHAGTYLPKETLEILLEHGADINATCDRGTTALIRAADSGDNEGVEFLLEKGADIHANSEKFGTALHAAAAEGDEEMCKILLKHGADVDAIGGNWGTALQAAAFAIDIDTVKVLLEAGADVDKVAGEYGCAVQAAANEGDEDVVRALIDHGANVNQAGGKYGFPLQAAAAEGHSHILEILLDVGAEVNLTGGHHGSALSAALFRRDYNDDCVDLLLDHGADAKVDGGLLGSTIQAAAYGNNSHYLEKLVEMGANPHFVGGKYGCALQTAALHPDGAFVDALLAIPVDVNTRGGKYETALQAAAYADSPEVVDKLLEHGADFRASGGYYQNAINAAAVLGHSRILTKFIELLPPDQMLDEALVEACFRKRLSSVEALLKAGANVNCRHPTLGSPAAALQAELPDGYNSDVDMWGSTEDDDEDSDDDSDDEDGDDQGAEWEGDDAGSDAGGTDASVTDLILEEEDSDQAKIQKLLDEALARVKRNPSVKRFRTVRRKALPASIERLPPSLAVGKPPRMSQTTEYTQFNPPAPPAQPQRMSQQQYQHPPGVYSGVSGPLSPPTGFQSISSPYQQPGYSIPAQHGAYDLPPQQVPGHPNQVPEPYKALPPHPGHGAPPGYETPSTLPPRQQSNQLPSRYRTSGSPSPHRPLASQSTPPPPPPQYGTPHESPIPPRQSLVQNPYPDQQSGYFLYGQYQPSQNSSQTSFQSSGYGQSTQYGGSQETLGHPSPNPNGGAHGPNGTGYQPYSTPNSSYSSGFGPQQGGWR